MMNEVTAQRTVLVTGATGYIGGRLVPLLLERGWKVRCLARSARKLEDRPWIGDPDLEVAEGDANDATFMEATLEGCDAAYYLIHSMIAAGGSYRERDRNLASTFAQAAAKAGVGRIVYLGGLGETGEDLSEHLASRREVEQVLREGGVPVTILRAAMIIGSGSASFEILRYLVEHLPVMITPKWVSTRCQPIAIRNVLGYLTDCLEVPETAGKILDIGGSEIGTYRDLMRIMAEERGLPRRWIIPVPVLTPRLSSLWIHLVTPVSAKIARPLAEGLRNEVICRDDEAQRLMPQALLSMRESIAAALGKLREHDVTTSWSSAGPMPHDPEWSGGTVFEDSRDAVVAASPAATFAACCALGGERGYHVADALWRLRGALDRLVGGPGLRRGRRDPDTLRYGDALDFWRVTRIEPNCCLELRAEMKVPGVATLTFDIEPTPDGGSRLVQTARFKPQGLLGLLYWYAVLPMHHSVFRGMFAGIARHAEWFERNAVPA